MSSNGESLRSPPGLGESGGAGQSLLGDVLWVQKGRPRQVWFEVYYSLRYLALTLEKGEAKH